MPEPLRRTRSDSHCSRPRADASCRPPKARAHMIPKPGVAGFAYAAGQE
jgi:hypothetical protein